jgi:AhpD family alkylhydroperoxidase
LPAISWPDAVAPSTALFVNGPASSWVAIVRFVNVRQSGERLRSDGKPHRFGSSPNARYDGTKEAAMPDDRIATVRAVEEREATGKVAAIFADIKKTKNLDFVPAFWRVIAINPAQLELVWTTLKSLMHPEAVGRSSRLDPATREIIALAVSATNACPYCINSHTAALRKLGLDDEALGEIMAIVGLFNMTNSLANGYQVEPDVRPPAD